jgi:plastocyanin/predicted secreted protein
MSAALPGILRSRVLVKLAALTGAAMLALAACAPANNPPSVPVAVKGTVLVNVVDSLFDAGRSASVQLDQNGQPAVAYLLYQPVLKEGEIPPAIKPGDPQPPSVVFATLSKGIWSRSPIPPQRGVGPAAGLDPEIANGDGQALPGITTALAMDGQGKHHVVWGTPKGLFYSTDAAGSFSEPDKVTGSPSYGVSIAVAEDGTVWISWYGGGSLNVAHGKSSAWTVEQAAVNAGPATDPAVASALRLTGNGSPVVAFDAGGKTVVASRPGTTWETAEVPGDGGYGVSLALDKDGNPHVAYYDAGGGIHHAHSIGGAPWEVTDLGTTPGAQSGQPDARWSSGIAVDDQGIHYVTWADTTAGQIVLATNQGGHFSSQPVQGSERGTNPSIAVSGDGKSLAIAWFDEVNANLDVAIPPAGGLVLAHPLPTLAPPSVTAQPTQTGTSLPCEPDGTTVKVSAQNTAFDTDCLAAPAGQAFTIEFTNNDAGIPHNVDIYDKQGGTHIGGAGPTDIFPGPGTTTYDVSPLDAGTYFFQCDVHPTNMLGTFVVAKPAG